MELPPVIDSIFRGVADKLGMGVVFEPCMPGGNQFHINRVDGDDKTFYFLNAPNLVTLQIDHRGYYEIYDEYYVDSGACEAEGHIEDPEFTVEFLVKHLESK